MNAYFDHIYYMPCMGFFHPETTYAQIQVCRCKSNPNRET